MAVRPRPVPARPSRPPRLGGRRGTAVTGAVAPAVALLVADVAGRVPVTPDVVVTRPRRPPDAPLGEAPRLALVFAPVVEGPGVTRAPRPANETSGVGVGRVVAVPGEEVGRPTPAETLLQVKGDNVGAPRPAPPWGVTAKTARAPGRAGTLLTLLGHTPVVVTHL